MQKNTSSTIISVLLLALLVWALSSGKKSVKPREESEATQLAKETPLVREGEKTPLEKPPEKGELKTTNNPPRLLASELRNRDVEALDQNLRAKNTNPSPRGKN